MRKSNPKKAAEDFISNIEEIKEFVGSESCKKLTQKHQTWAYEYAIIRLYREFEVMILNSLIAAINIDTSELSKSTSIKFPKHLKREVCEYIIVGDGYFNFRGRDGLIGDLQKFVQEDHYLVKIIKKRKYRLPLNRLSAFRNFAAHDSIPAKKKALKAADQNRKRIASAGAWLKTNSRFDKLCNKLEQLAQEIVDYHRNQGQ